VSEEFDFSTGMPSEEMSEYLQMFVDETTEQLDELVEVLLVLESNPHSSQHLNESFRLIHSIKGAAAMMGLDSIMLLTHHLENHFERLRSGLWTLDRDMMDLVLKCVDFLREATHKLREGKPLATAPELIELLAAAQPSEMSRPTKVRKRITVYFDRSVELVELKAELITVRLQEIGTLVRTSPQPDLWTSLADLRTMQIWIDTEQANEAVHSAADIVGVELLEIDLDTDDATEEDESSPVLPPDIATAPATAPATVSATVPATVSPPEPKPAPSPEISPPEISPSELSPAGAYPNPVPSPRDRSDPQEPPGHAIEPSNAIETSKIPETGKMSETVRVDLDRLDRLMNLAGELIVSRARFVQLASQLKETFQKTGLQSRLRDLCESLRSKRGNEESNQDRCEIASLVQALEDQMSVLEQGHRSYQLLHEAIDQFTRVSDGLQQGVLDTRMIPVGPLFNRFKRTIRDISGELGKKVHLEIRGETTELDKRMIDELGDPLVHLVRNAIDHGIESESVRIERGKAALGTIKLEAEHRGNNVLITISDDGGGLNIEKIKNRAIHRGLATAAEIELMSDFEIQQFIWAPGFSTAERVSDISGRGVGMDIVRTRIRELSGTIEVHSTPGQGSKFVLRMPLTLAIIRSLLFQLEDGTFAAPIEHVREIVSVRDMDILSVQGRHAIELRGEFLPLVWIDDVFDWQRPATTSRSAEPSQPRGETKRNVLILSTGTKSMGLVVSELAGCQDIVIKSLGDHFTSIRGLSGASILGDGSVCLLLDVPSCLELARERLRDRDQHAKPQAN